MDSNPNSILPCIPQHNPSATLPIHGTSDIEDDNNNKANEAVKKKPHVTQVQMPTGQLINLIHVVSTTPAEHEISISDTEEDSDEWHAFCPDIYHKKIIQMMVSHLNAHPMIHGYSAPTRDRICYWAVKEMYLYCVKNELSEVWAYMWENWYRPGRWELWACSVHKDLPVL
ncbi:hypothetical protein GYMLUDRAFT_60821 [Collybiopsis luxurians FD-317 M1]|uniref:Uncharacterized protein n=1 Tax=Collybiopsis luxurians FD-317 M1 TaxID=944289 RepID=A0A0D0B4M1_9AGAR|nr:hypothetical protein GYMLUDRAFT_60821 [Collybiopsis luxurians FD-317 M1]